MRHPQWKEVERFLGDITGMLGSSIFDNRCGKSWDVGQAVCAEAYGPNWMKDATFVEWNQKDDDEPPERHYYECAKNMAGGYVPEWIRGAA